MWMITIEGYDEKTRQIVVTTVGPFKTRTAAEYWWMASPIKHDENFLTSSIGPCVAPRNIVQDRLDDFVGSLYPMEYQI